MSPIALHQPILVQPASGDPSLVTTGQEFRNYTKAVLAASDISNAQGVLSPGALQVTQRGAGANLSVDVASGVAAVLGDDVTSQGTYACWNDATVNIPSIPVPISGTFHHRIVLQIEDHLELGSWPAGTYAAVLLPLLDTGGGLPAEPNSAITLATIDVPSGSASITNAMINDFRVVIGALAATKPGDTARTGTSMSDDPDLQLVNLCNSCKYRVTAVVFYTGGTGASEGDLKYTWRTSGGASGTYASQQIGTGGAPNFQHVIGNWTDTNFAGTTGGAGGAANQAMVFEGMYLTSSRPAYLVFQWAQNTSTGTNTTVKANSYISARRLT